MSKFHINLNSIILYELRNSIAKPGKVPLHRLIGIRQAKVTQPEEAIGIQVIKIPKLTIKETSELYKTEQKHLKALKIISGRYLLWYLKSQHILWLTKDMSAF